MCGNGIGISRWQLSTIGACHMGMIPQRFDESLQGLAISENCVLGKKNQYVALRHSCRGRSCTTMIKTVPGYSHNHGPRFPAYSHSLVI
jgi:hypothetical protein